MKPETPTKAELELTIRGLEGQVASDKATVKKMEKMHAEALEQWSEQEGLRKKAECERDELRKKVRQHHKCACRECIEMMSNINELNRRLEGVLETEKAWENRFLSLVGDRTPEGAGNAVITLKGRLEAHHKSMAVDATEECPCCHVLKWAES